MNNYKGMLEIWLLNKPEAGEFVGFGRPHSREGGAAASYLERDIRNIPRNTRNLIGGLIFRSRDAYIPEDFDIPTNFVKRLIFLRNISSLRKENFSINPTLSDSTKYIPSIDHSSENFKYILMICDGQEDFENIKKYQKNIKDCLHLLGNRRVVLCYKHRCKESLSIEGLQSFCNDIGANLVHDDEMELGVLGPSFCVKLRADMSQYMEQESIFLNKQKCPNLSEIAIGTILQIIKAKESSDVKLHPFFDDLIDYVTIRDSFGEKHSTFFGMHMRMFGFSLGKYTKTQKFDSVKRLVNSLISFREGDEIIAIDNPEIFQNGVLGKIINKHGLEVDASRNVSPQRRIFDGSKLTRR